MLGSAFNIGANGLRTIQTRLNTISNNIANADTKGYHREVVIVGESSVGRPDNGGQFGGNGVEVMSITRMMDLNLAKRIQQASVNYSESSTQQKALSISEQVLADQASQVGSSIQEFSNSIGEVSKDASSPAAREKMLGAGNNLVNRMNDVLSGLEGTSSTLRQQQTASIEEANQLAKQLAETNNNIRAVYGPDTYALRDRALTQARALADKVGGTLTVTDGGLFNFSLPNGKSLVDGDTAATMTADDISVAGGEIGGRRMALEKIDAYSTKFKGLMSDVATAFNNLHTAGVDLNGNAGKNFFNVAADGKLTVNITDYHEIAAGDGAGSMDNANALRMENFVNMDVTEGGTATFSEGYSALQTSIGTYIGTVDQDQSADQETLQGLEDFQQRTEGVDKEQEGIALMQAQRHYEAMAQVIKTADSMLGTLLSIKS